MAEFIKAYKKLEVIDISKFKDDWVIIDNFPSYKINSDGIVININTNKILKHNINNGYYDVTLTKNKKHYRVKIHRLLANAFIPKIKDKPYIDHIDGNRLNNSISEAAKAVNGDSGTISAICSNKIKYSKGRPYKSITHKGYKWKYLYGKF